VDLSISSIKFVPGFDNTTHVILRIPRSKTDPFRTGMDVYLAKAPDAITCPVAALCTLISFYRQNGSGLDHKPHTPLFVIKGKAVTVLMVPQPPCALLKACTPVEESSQLQLPNTGVSLVCVDQPVGDP
jgi:hypothetical protein